MATPKAPGLPPRPAPSAPGRPKNTPPPIPPLPNTPPPIPPLPQELMNGDSSPASPSGGEGVRPARPQRPAPSPGAASGSRPPVTAPATVPPRPSFGKPPPPQTAGGSMIVRPTEPMVSVPSTSLDTNSSPGRVAVPPRPPPKALQRGASSPEVQDSQNTNGSSSAGGLGSGTSISRRPPPTATTPRASTNGGPVSPRNNGTASPGESPPASSYNGPGSLTSSGSEAGFSTEDMPPEAPIAPQPKLNDDPRRANIVWEILQTEKEYIDRISKMIKNYKGPLMTMAMTDSSVQQADMKTMFSNVHLILPLNQELLNNIQGRIDDWSPTQKLGDVFLRMAPFMKMYNEYGNNYKDALRIYNQYCAENPKFVETLQFCKEACKPPINLESLLITPIQRIPRYNLLLEDLIKHTDKSHPDYQELTKALAIMKEVSQHINTSVKKTDNLRKLAEASSKGTGFRGLMEAHRQLLRDGLLQTTDSRGRKEKLHFYLFNDILVYADKNAVRKQTDMTKLGSQWPIELVWLTNTTATTFDLVGPTTTFTISSSDDQNAWVTDIQKLLTGRNLQPDYREGSFDFGVAAYTGQWLNGKIHGQGRYTFFGNEYEGQWENGLKSGTGTLRYTTGDVYEGQWANDRQHGLGVLMYANGAMYRGEWSAGKKHNHGEFVAPNGDKYSGGWKEDLFSGQGKLVLQTGVVYDGQWLNGKFHGKGTLTLPSGKVYVGEWVAGQKEGHGTLDCGNGERYEGTWKQGKKHGAGTYTTLDAWATYYVGNWAMGKKEGQGSMTYMDGSRYEGSWKGDKPHGKGVFTFANGDVYTGTFKNGLMQGNGVYTYAQAVLEYSGKFEDGTKEGKCTISRTLSDKDKAEAAESGTQQMVKLQGNFSEGRITVTNSTDTHTVHIQLTPAPPSFDFTL